MASEEEKADAAAAKKCDDIHQAARNGDVPALRHFLRVAPDKVHEKDWLGQTPLHWAAANGHVAAAEFLLSKGAAVDAKDGGGFTPLHAAANNGHVAAAEFLLSKGAAVDAVDAKNNGKTPLDLARSRGKTEMVQLLLNPPAKKPSADDGKTPPDLSNKGKAEKEPLPTAADKTSEAGKKDAAPHAAGSGVVAVKHQRETSKEEAAKALKKAMESGNVEVLKEAIAAAKVQKVSHEDVLEAMDKLIALTESANN